MDNPTGHLAFRAHLVGEAVRTKPETREKKVEDVDSDACDRGQQSHVGLGWSGRPQTRGCLSKSWTEWGDPAHGPENIGAQVGERTRRKSVSRDKEGGGGRR